tara:strand:- start:22 stop:693 length:672 start_codon:yes stop_codon:yes gene_type:complete
MKQIKLSIKIRLKTLQKFLDNRLFFPATQRNSNYIGNVLSKFLPEDGSILEIGSGSGEHAVIFQQRFQNITWQASDPEPSHRESIRSWINYHDLSLYMPEPIDIDVEKRPWPISSILISNLRAVICINMLHISSWNCSKALFEESSNLLKKNQLLMLYGPFKKEGLHTSESNLLFDISLKDKNKNWGVRDIEEVFCLAKENGFTMKEVIKMPANNLSIIFIMN